MIKQLLFAFALCCLIQSCADESTLLAKGGNKHFDIPAYFTNEISQLQEQNKSIKKTITINGVEESKVINDVEWAGELALFKGHNINKTSWQDDFEKVEGKGKVTFTTSNESIPIKTVEIRPNETNPTTIKITYHKKNVLSDVKQEMVFQKNKSYVISYESKSLFSEKQVGKIEGVFVD